TISRIGVCRWQQVCSAVVLLISPLSLRMSVTNPRLHLAAPLRSWSALRRRAGAGNGCKQHKRSLPIPLDTSHSDCASASMSALGQSRHWSRSEQCPLIPEADINRRIFDVRFVPEADSGITQALPRHTAIGGYRTVSLDGRARNPAAQSF